MKRSYKAAGIFAALSLGLANRAEMEKRAKEKGTTLPEHRGPHTR